MDLLLKISVLQANVLLAGLWKKNMCLERKCCWEKDNSGFLRGFDVEKSCGLFVLNPFPLLKGWISPSGHTHFPFLYSTQPPPPPPALHWRSQFGPITTLQTGQYYLDIRLLWNVPVSHVASCRCTLLAGNSSISLAESEEQIHFSQQSPKMLKMDSQSFIHALLLFLGLFLKMSRWVPLTTWEATVDSR